MATYTTQVRSIVEAGVNLFDFDYPIFDESYRATLENNIIQYYYFREIGLETVAQFKQFLKAKLNVVMPFYNQMYNAQKEFLTKDLFFNKNLTDTYSKTSEIDTTNAITGNISTSQNGSSDNTSTNTGDTTDTEKFYDTPNSQLSDNKDDYLTTETTTEHTGTTTVTENGTTTETGSSNSEENVTGNATATESYTLTSSGDDGMRYPASVYTEVMDSFQNIDMKIIDDLRGLFMNVY